MARNSSSSAFIDEAEITVIGGGGGAGAVSFLRERARPDGGPDGGNGGGGGAVIARANRAVNTLLAYRYQKRIAAANGKRGGSNNKHGGAGGDKIIDVPPGTRIVDSDMSCLHADLTRHGEQIVLAHGGAGGLGNSHFKSSTNRAPRTATPGGAGETRSFRLELKLMADIGLLGLPNAGKSTFLRALTTANAKTGDYPFTTLKPQLGILSLVDTPHTQVTIADIPGLVAGAARGAGLGNRFLRHLARVDLLCHIADIASETLDADCRGIDDELRQAADESLPSKPRWLILNKSDLLTADETRQRQEAMRRRFPVFARVFALSALTGAGAVAVARAMLDRYEPRAR